MHPFCICRAAALSVVLAVGQPFLWTWRRNCPRALVRPLLLKKFKNKVKKRQGDVLVRANELWLGLEFRSVLLTAGLRVHPRIEPAHPDADSWWHATAPWHPMTHLLGVSHLQAGRLACFLLSLGLFVLQVSHTWQWTHFVVVVVKSWKLPPPPTGIFIPEKRHNHFQMSSLHPAFIFVYPLIKHVGVLPPWANVPVMPWVGVSGVGWYSPVRSMELELEELAESFLCDKSINWFRKTRFSCASVPLVVNYCSFHLHQGLITWDMESTNVWGADNFPPMGAAWTPGNHAFPEPCVGWYCLMLLNVFILGGPSSIIDILKSLLSKWRRGRNPEVPVGSEFAQWEHYVVVTNT